MAPEAHVVGVDAGGSKTEWRWLSPHGLTLGTGRLEGFNLQTTALEPWAQSLRDALETFRQQHRLPQPALVALGAAGVYTPKERHRVRQVLQEILGVPVEVLADVEIAYYAAHGHQPGLLLIAGTGSIALARTDRGEEVRAGGYGLLLDDEGSGAWIGLRAMQAALQAYDGRGPETRLVDLWLQHQTPRDLALAYGRASPGEFARWFPRIMALADEDPVARDIVNQAQEALLRLVQALAHRFHEPPRTFVFTGGLFRHTGFLRLFLDRARAQGWHPRPLDHPPSWGAARYARDRLAAAPPTP